MESSRRGFLGLMAGGAASIRGVADSVAQDVGLRGVTLGGSIGGASGNCASVKGGGISDQARLAAWKAFGVPQWMRDDWWDEAKGVHYLDPDLAVHVSTSLPFRLGQQRARNYRRAEGRFWGRLKDRATREAWEERNPDAPRW